MSRQKNAMLVKAEARIKDDPDLAESLAAIMLTGMYRAEFTAKMSGVDQGNTYHTHFPFDGVEWEFSLTRKPSA